MAYACFALVKMPFLVWVSVKTDIVHVWHWYVCVKLRNWVFGAEPNILFCFFFSFLDKIRITWNRSSTGQDSFSRNSHAKINGWMQKLHAKTDGRSQIYFRERHAIAISSVYFAVILCVIVTIRWMLTTYSIQRCNTTDDREKKTATFASIGHWMRVYVTAPTTTKCAYSRQTEWIAWIYMYIFIIIRVWKLHWGIGLHWAISHLQRQAQSKSSNAHICTLFLCCFSIPLEDPSLSLSLPF